MMQAGVREKALCALLKGEPLAVPPRKVSEDVESDICVRRLALVHSSVFMRLPMFVRLFTGRRTLCGARGETGAMQVYRERSQGPSAVVGGRGKIQPPAPQLPEHVVSWKPPSRSRPGRESN